MTTFRKWIHLQDGRDDPVGDLARDMKRDPYQRLPNPSLRELYGHIICQLGSSLALDALIEAYREWQDHGNTYRSTRDDRRRQAGWLKLRYLVLRRDGFRCQLCGHTAQDGVKLEIDHKVPRSRGGSDDESNLWTLCFDCNRGKRDRTL